MKKSLYTQLKTSRQINDIRDTGPDTENTDHGPDMGFYGPLVNQSEQRILKRHIIITVIHAFVTSRLDYWNSIL